MKTRLLSRSDVVEIVRKVGHDALMDAMISSLTDVFLRYDSRAVEVRKRDGFNYDRCSRTLISPEVAGGLLEWMPVLELGAASTIKMVAYNPKNPARHGIPTIMATMFQHDIKTGHLVAITDGADVPGKTECPATVVDAAALVCPDFRAQAIVEGECQQLPEDRIGPSLPQIVKDRAHCKDYRSRLTIFDSTGFAREDKVAMELFLGYAENFGLGTDVTIESTPLDPLDPYALEIEPLMVRPADRGIGLRRN